MQEVMSGPVARKANERPEVGMNWAVLVMEELRGETKTAKCPERCR